MLNFPDPKLLKISTPYLRYGVLWEDVRRHWGQDSPDVLVWRASSLLMNPSLKAERLDQERRKDPDRFRREYEAEFAENLEGFLRSETIAAAVVRDRWELPPVADVRYTAAVDPSGGGPDAFTVAIVHIEEDRIILDLVRGWAKARDKSVDLKAIVAESSELLRRYGLRAVVGDRYGGEWPVQAFRDHGIRYYPARWSKAEAYLALESLLLQRRVELLEHRELIRELGLLERRHHAGGRVAVDHPPGGYHDDHANALALAAMMAERTRPRDRDDERPESPTDLYLKERRAEEIATFKRTAAARGIDPAVIDALEAEVPAAHLRAYVEELLEEGTIKGRLRRAGLL